MRKMFCCRYPLIVSIGSVIYFFNASKLWLFGYSEHSPWLTHYCVQNLPFQCRTTSLFRAKAGRCSTLTSEDLLLLDSGAQYQDGTTGN